MTLPPSLWICHNHSCRHQGAAALWNACHQYRDTLNPPSAIALQRAGCLGHCGSGPVAVGMPGERWYLHLQPDQIAAVFQDLEPAPAPLDADPPEWA
jgi:NADH:ubiquinone oxidoreductase subunit E